MGKLGRLAVAGNYIMLCGGEKNAQKRKREKKELGRGGGEVRGVGS